MSCPGDGATVVIVAITAVSTVIAGIDVISRISSGTEDVEPLTGGVPVGNGKSSFMFATSM